MRMMKGKRKRRWICEGVAGAAAPFATGNRKAEERKRKNEEKEDGKEEGARGVLYKKGRGAFGLLKLGDSLMICSPNLP